MQSHHARDLTDAQWAVLDPLIPEPTRREDGRGRPWKPRRSVLNGILWVLRTGAPWRETCLRGIRPTKPVIAVFRIGFGQAS